MRTLCVLPILAVVTLVLPGCDARGVMLAGGPAGTDGGVPVADAGGSMDTGPEEKFHERQWGKSAPTGAFRAVENWL